MRCPTTLSAQIEKTSSPSWCIHRWRIEKFSYYFPAGRLHWKNCIESRVFKPENSKLTFFMRLYPHGNEQNNREHASLEFGCLESSLVGNINLKLTFVMENARRQKRFKTIAVHNFGQNDLFVCKQFIRLAELNRDKKNLLPNDSLTICCSIQEQEHSNLIQGIAQTESVHKPNLLSHIWTIENFTNYLNGGQISWKNSLKTKTFSSNSIEFYLSLYPNGSSVNDKDHISIFLYLNSQFEDRHVPLFNWTISLIGENETRCNMKTAKNSTLTEKGLGYLKFISHGDLKNYANKYLCQNKLTIAVDIEDVGNELIRGYTESSSCTAISGLSHIWTIENFTDYLNGGKMWWKKSLNSKDFSTPDGNTKLNLSLNPNGTVTEESKNDISVFLCLKKQSDTKYNFAFALIDANGWRRNIKAFKEHTLSIHVSGFHKFISHSDLLNPQNNYLTQNKLTIAVDIEDADCKIIHDYHETRSTTKSNCQMHIWTIENFASLGKSGWAWKLGFKSYIDSNAPSEKTKFFLRLYPNGDKDRDYIALYLMSNDKREIGFNCTFAIFGNAVNKIKEFTKNVSNQFVGYSNLISRADLFDSKNGYLKNDVLTINCGISDEVGQQIRGYSEIHYEP